MSDAWGGSSSFSGPGYAPLDRVKATLQVDAQDLGLDDTNSDADGDSDWDNFLQVLQGKAKAQIDSFTDRDFEPYDGVTLDLDGGASGTKVLRLPHPVRNVSKVVEEGATLREGDDYEWKPNGSLIKLGSGGSAISRYGSSTPYSTLQAQRPEWAMGYNNIQVTLDYGPASPPADIIEAEAMLVDHATVGFVQKREAPVVQSDDYSISANIPVSLTSEIKELLRSHRIQGLGS